MSMFEYYEPLIDATELANRLNCGMNTVYKLLNEKKIKAWKIGRTWKIPEKAVTEYIYQQSQMKMNGWC